VIDKNADGLVSYGEFQSWHRIALGAEPKQSAGLEILKINTALSNI